MRLKIWVFAVLVGLAGQAAADDRLTWYERGEFWTGDTFTDSAWLGMNVSLIIDWGQTRYIAKNPDLFYETNKHLGEHPTTREVDKHFAYALIGTNTVHYFLPDNWKPYFSGFFIAMEYGHIENNYQIGIKTEF